MSDDALDSRRGGYSNVEKAVDDSLEWQVELRKIEDQFMEVSFADVVDTQYYRNWLKTDLQENDINPLAISQAKEGSLVNIVYREPPEPLLYKILYSLGVDIDREVESLSCTHRRFNGDIVTTLRYNGYRRSDPKWKSFINKHVRNLNI